MKHLPLVPLLAAAFTILTAAPANADTIMLGASRDNTLFENTGGALSNGAGEWLFTGLTAQDPFNDQRRALLAFDLSGIAPGSIITSVTLTLAMDRSISGPSDVGVHRVLQDWGEGTSDASGQEGTGTGATTGDATWLHTFSSTSLWTNPGGDFDPTASATVSVGAEDNYSWDSAAMAADVQSWVDNGATNFGWLLLGDESGGISAKRFASRENLTGANLPQLTVNFSAVPEPSRSLLLVAAIALGTARRRRS